MVKVYGPMMSLDAAGTLADALTFSKWKGRNYVRNRVIPSNPRSGAQVGRRAMLNFLAKNWNAISDADKATWQDLADELISSRFNAYASQNMKGWHNFLAPSQATPTTRQATPSDRTITVAEWEENRIKLTTDCSVPADQWGIILFASLTGTFNVAVGNTVIARLDNTPVQEYDFWTPPSVTTWYFNSITFSLDGKQATAGGEVLAVPP